MPRLTLTQTELCDIKNKVCEIFVDYEKTMTKLNKVGSKYDMREGNELFAYTWLLEELAFPDYQDDTYVSILSNIDIYKMYNRAREISANFKRNSF